ncbi:MDR family NADP-dependent oxidoreductase [Aeromicrobium wangtongii]|uniref:NADP-dependent oxidoreductase n=2 Tax=Aeromicrobium wangtongii TaxID=2969247 RepID=A0ABY5MAN7_9ACTN|nr:NADP-dependent oxidoreductase [Aeromicrobium wangtongii]MCD9197701.1 NADP-dependent oxidoreductase [Aeromicrobium wangtongii]UUP15185.1 NADP-dependent oxidoreductase [Aeromicrobium wangtongii]
MGARSVGIAGGPAKCAWLVSECGLDAAIDYKTGNLRDQLEKACPAGIDVFFDNVGGDTLQAAVDTMARFGRIVLCGQISGYTDSVPIPGPENMMRLIYGGITMQGFLLEHFEDDLAEGWHHLQSWLRNGSIVHREDVRAGFAAIPESFPALFDGTNAGTLMVTAD